MTKSSDSGQPTVLLASKDAFFVEMVVDILDRDNVVVVDSCEKAFEHVLENDFDFLIFDPDLEPLKGSEAIRIIKKMNPNIPLITVTDDESFETEVKIAETGVFFRLTKPINEQMTKTIVETVQKKIRR